MSPDFFNALFEVLAGFFVLNHCRVLYRHKSTRGVSIVSTIFFCLWGFWNLYYYPVIGQFWSFAGGIFVVMANTVYVCMMVFYQRSNNSFTFNKYGLSDWGHKRYMDSIIPKNLPRKMQKPNKLNKQRGEA